MPQVLHQSHIVTCDEIVKSYVRESLSSLTPRHFWALSMESLTVTLGRNVEDGRLNTIFGIVRFAFICSVAEDPENLASFSSLTRAKGRFLVS